MGHKALRDNWKKNWNNKTYGWQLAPVSDHIVRNKNLMLTQIFVLQLRKGSHYECGFVYKNTIFNSMLINEIKF